MLVKAAYRRVTKEHAAAPVWLETVFMGVNDQGIDFGKTVIFEAGLRGKGINQNVIHPISRIGMDAKAVTVTELQELRQGINSADGGCTDGGDHCADAPFPEASLQGLQIKPAETVRGDRLEIQLEYAADPLMGIVSL